MHISVLSQLSCHNCNRCCKKDSAFDRIGNCMNKFIRQSGHTHKNKYQTYQHLQCDHSLYSLFSHGEAFQKYNSQRQGRCDPPRYYRIAKQTVKQIKEGFNNYTAPRQLIRKPQILLQIRNSSQRSNAQDQTLNELNRFYLVVYEWKSYLKWSKGDVGQFIFSSLCSCICHTNSPFQ